MLETPIQVPFYYNHVLQILVEHSYYDHRLEIGGTYHEFKDPSGVERLYNLLCDNEEYVARLEYAWNNPYQEYHKNASILYRREFNMKSEIEDILGELGEVGPDKLW